ncbi:hydroxysqualene dehydroxylase HpnE [Aureimonas leprariae]|uniref:NAD(P)-binding protein n=1 Tax=Plantimonas leprariae TaxID=2615207 RepID=A0A7V7PQQ4_9HYPH|nr:hydroxysqualene dehydroxylase HpnE [Aureimonas leprariae]KAB0680640.1 NAD(P)-binding protein [Aureimonas leprariae]
MGTVHVIGAGLAGLAAAEAMLGSGTTVVVHEAARQAGGRCRSYHDVALDMRIDNGNHLLLSGNRTALEYVARIGGGGALEIANECAFPFVDLGSGERWTLRPNAGRVPRWIFDPARRVPGSRASDYLSPLRLFLAGPNRRLGQVMPTTGPIYERLWHPLLLAALNTDPAEASARLAATLMRETLGMGGDACRPVIASGGLGAALVDPAVALLERRGMPVRFGSSLRGLDVEGGRVAGLRLTGEDIRLGPDDRVVLAVPAWVARSLLPDLAAPDEHRAIANAHFRIAPPPGMPTIVGLVRSLSEWIFAFPDRLSVTISGADRLNDRPRETLAADIWREVAAVAGLSAEPMPPWQIVREKRATFRATPEQVAKRPKTRTPLDNLFLAGDWTDTGLPATIEGAIRSGRKAAELALRSGGRISRNRMAA